MASVQVGLDGISLRHISGLLVSWPVYPSSVNGTHLCGHDVNVSHVISSFSVSHPHRGFRPVLKLGNSRSESRVLRMKFAKTMRLLLASGVIEET